MHIVSVLTPFSCYCLVKCSEFINHSMGTWFIVDAAANHIYCFVFVRIQSDYYNAQQLSYTQTCLCTIGTGVSGYKSLTMKTYYSILHIKTVLVLQG